MTNHPPQLPPAALPDVVLADTGGWISGPGISFDEVPADEVGPADRLLLDDGMLVTVVSVTQGVFWLPESREHGVEIVWEQQDGTATGTLIRRADTIVQRVRDGARVTLVRGPFETADEARELPEVRAIYESWAPGSLLADGARQLLVGALGNAGVSLGAYDRALTAWMAGFEPQVVAVIASWVTRAAAVPGLATLDGGQAATVLDALAVAAEAKGDRVATCPECADADGALCETCAWRRQAAEGYEAVAEHIRGAS